MTRGASTLRGMKGGKVDIEAEGKGKGNVIHKTWELRLTNNKEKYLAYFMLSIVLLHVTFFHPHSLLKFKNIATYHKTVEHYHPFDCSKIDIKYEYFAFVDC